MVETNVARDFSSKPAFNGIACREGEELVPVVLTKSMKMYLKELGLKEENIRTWRMPNGKTVKVAFVPNPIGGMDAAIKAFNSDVEVYLKHIDEQGTGDLSLDEFLDDLNEEDEKGFDPTGTTENEDRALLESVFEMLLDDLSKQDKNMAKIIKLLADGYMKNEILDVIDLKKGKTQGYKFIEKTQKIARDIYYREYHD